MMVPPRSEADTSSPSRNQSLAMSSADGAALMREQDADILQQGIADACSTATTPVLEPISESPPSNLALNLPPVESSRRGSPSGDAVNRHVVDRNANNGTLNPPQERRNEDLPDSSTEGSAIHVLAGIELDATGADTNSSCLTNDKRKLIVRRCLSGDERTYTFEQAQDGGSTGVSPVSVTDEVLSPSPDVTSSEATESSSMERSGSIPVRSKSKERLLSEVQLFSESVGEMPPAIETEIQEIIEGSGSDDDDDDDDDAKEVRICDSPAALSSHSPRKTAGHQGGPRSPVPKRPGVRPRITGVANKTVQSADIENVRPPLVAFSDPVVSSQQPDFKSGLQWPFKPGVRREYPFLHKLPDGLDKEDFKYKGICSNPPEITQRGISRGNYAQLHRKAWLEVSDKYHRYGKNLRMYYTHWESLGHPTNMFFDWLDSKGEAAGDPLPNLPECPRSQLDSDTVLYILNEEMQQRYLIDIVPDEEGRALMIDVDGDPVQTGSEGWIFVLRDHKFYAAEKITSITGRHSKQRFHHSSFFGGKAVAAAGIMITENGNLTRLYPHSGHYRPGEAHMQRMLFHLHHCGVDLRTFDVDTQQILHVSRKDGAPKGGTVDVNGAEKRKKIHSLYLKPAFYVACFLCHKARFIGEGIFAQIHRFRKADVTSVTEALDAVDEGGYWKKLRRELRG